MRNRTVFHTWEAHAAYVDNLLEDSSKLRWLLLSDGHDVRLICPLEARTDRTLGRSIPVWGLFAHPHWPLADVICPEDDARRAFVPVLAEYLRQSGERCRLAVLGPLPEESVLWEGLRGLGPRDYAADASARTFVFDCDKPLDDLRSRLPSHFRKDLRRQGRRLQALDDVRFETRSAAGNPGFDALFEDFLRVESSGWKGASGTGSAVALQQAHRAFYRALATDFGEGDACEISALYAQGQCIAAEFSMRTGGEYATLKVGYNQSFARFSPGHLLLDLTLERCCNDPRIQRYNQLSDASWLHVWRPDAIELTRAYVSIDPLVGPALVWLSKRRFGEGRRAARALRRVLSRS